MGHLARFTLLPGQRAEITGIEALMEGLSCGAFIADKAYDADGLRAMLAERRIKAVIPARKGRKAPASHDERIYAERHLIENFFQKLKDFKRIAMRACKTDQSFSAMICLAATLITLR